MGPSIEEMTMGVSNAGMEAYKENLRLKIVDETINLIDNYQEVETELEKCWVGTSKDKFMKEFAVARESIKTDLKLEQNDLEERLLELEALYFKQDEEMMNS